MTGRVQRYRLTHEFVLRDRGDYQAYSDALRDALTTLAEHWVGAQSDMIFFEKVEESHDHSQTH